MAEIIISVCCLAYNHEKYIRECLEGFINQKTDFTFEVLIHDDASTDKTAEIIREFEVKYPKIIKPIYQSENQYSKGIAVSSKYNLSRAKGKYIAMCEGDDYWTDPLKLQKQVDFLENNKEYGMVHTNFDTYYQNDNYFLKNTHSVYNIDLKDNCTLDYWNFFGKEMATIKTLTTCFRYDLIKKWGLVKPKNKWLIGDFPLYFYLSLQSKVGYINESTSVYRTVPQGSLSNLGNDNKKKLNLRKTYVDIRLHFLKKYNLDKSKYQQAFIRDLNLLLDLCVITDKNVVMLEYFEIAADLELLPKVNLTSKIYLESNMLFINYFLRSIVKLKLFHVNYTVKLFNLKFLSSTLSRKLKFKNV